MKDISWYHLHIIQLKKCKWLYGSGLHVLPKGSLQTSGTELYWKTWGTHPAFLKAQETMLLWLLTHFFKDAISDATFSHLSSPASGLLSSALLQRNHKKGLKRLWFKDPLTTELILLKWHCPHVFDKRLLTCSKFYFFFLVFFLLSLFSVCSVIFICRPFEGKFSFYYINRKSYREILCKQKWTP